MDNKAISKMNKKELYQKCQEQQQEIQKLSLFQDYHEDIINDYDDDSDNLLEKIRILKVKNASYADMYKNVDNKLKEDNEKLRKENKQLKNYECSHCDNAHISLIIKNNYISKIKSEFIEENEKLKEELEELQQRYNKLEDLF